jgi:hypothetical protein
MFTPSIKLEHSDDRGEIYSIALPDNQEMMLLHSNAGVFRGGHWHSCDEVVMLLSGAMRYHKHINGKDQTTLMEDGDASYNGAGQIHMGEFLEDSWVIEYKLGTAVGAWTQENYPPYRAKVEGRAA